MHQNLYWAFVRCCYCIFFLCYDKMSDALFLLVSFLHFSAWFDMCRTHLFVCLIEWWFALQHCVCNCVDVTIFWITFVIWFTDYCCHIAHICSFLFLQDSCSVTSSFVVLLCLRCFRIFCLPSCNRHKLVLNYPQCIPVACLSDCFASFLCLFFVKKNTDLLASSLLRFASFSNYLTIMCNHVIAKLVWAPCAPLTFATLPPFVLSGCCDHHCIFAAFLLSRPHMQNTTRSPNLCFLPACFPVPPCPYTTKHP